jgi:sigma-E factor negative regulatory protein RseB
LRYGYQLWIEKSTGLLLRAQTLNEKNEVVEQITFTHISIGNINYNRVKSSFANVSAWRIENAVMRQIKLDAWSVKWLPPGFKKTREVKRLVSDGSDKVHSTAPREVSQIVFSDGLAAVSVFIEPGTQSLTEGSMQQGAMNIMGKRQGDFWITIVGEVPALAIRKIADSIEYKK